MSHRAKTITFTNCYGSDKLTGDVLQEYDHSYRVIVGKQQYLIPDSLVVAINGRRVS